MSDDIHLKINDLMRQLDAKQKEFDQWLDKQYENLRSLKKQQDQEKVEHEKQINQIKTEKANILKRIEMAKADQQKFENKEKEIQVQQSKLEKEISEIPCDFEFYKNQIYLLNMKRTRLTNANIQKSEETKKIISALEAYETLFGVSIQVEEGTTTFTFSNPKSKVVISEISNKYQFVEIPRQLSLYQRTIMDDFNNEKNLFNFISSIRSHLY